ncbi:MAG TPA: hypothetical protein PLY87_29535 [Planctomycetaceae bacterium]|nr:hypothetical protein [Planctomycetaceae bacterium]HQZ69279.1 hypothetical protein [Planctomycetaceae bacterium]
MLHHAWSDGSFFPIINCNAAGMVEAGATLIWTIEAPSWTEAMTRHYEKQGWKPYVPLDDDPVAYTTEEEIEAARLIAAGDKMVCNDTNTLMDATNTAEGETQHE